jgi:recombination protein RecT
MTDTKENNELATATPNQDLAAAKDVNPMSNAANMVRKYATGLINDKRAQQFAFQIAIMTKDVKNGDKLLACNSESMLSAMMACVHLDLMPNTSEGLAYIIPYGNTATFQLGYKGLVELAYRSGVILSVNAELVFPEDTFEFELGTERRLIHKPSLTVKDRTDYTKVIAVYATAKLTNGEFVFEVMTKPDLDKVKKSSKAASSGPWVEWPEAMAKKTAVKRLLKLLPSSTTDNRFKQAAQWDSVYESGKRLKVDAEGSIIDGEVVNDDTSISEETRLAIENATNRDDLMAILYKLPVSNRKAATDLVNSRLLEIVKAKKK